jgi:hypothetical protein
MKANKIVVPLLVAGATGGIAYLAAKTVGVSKAVNDIDYDISVKNFRIHSVNLIPFSVNTRFALDIKLINPTVEKFKISHPDVVVKYKGTEIGRSTIQNKTYELAKRSEVTIKDIQFEIDLAYVQDDLKDFISEIKSSWSKGDGLIKNTSSLIENGNKTLTKYSDSILKNMTAKVGVIINNVPLSYEDTLAGYRAVGSLAFGYSPISAIDRVIDATPETDQYFPVPQGNKELIKRNADVFETVKLMIDVVNKDHKLVKDASLKIFKRDTIEETAKNIFDWIYRYIKYNLEVGEQLRNPATTYHLAQRMARDFHKKNGYYSAELSADCDDISIFIASIFKNLGIPYLFRIADYTGAGYSHVYTLIPRQGKPPVIIDPVYHQFNSEQAFIKEKTFDMSKNILSGIDVYYLSGIASPFGNLLGNTLEYLINSRNAIASNPNAYQHIAEPETLIAMYDYAIKYWNTPDRGKAIEILAQQEEKLIAAGLIRQGGIAGTLSGKFFEKIKNLFKGNNGKTQKEEVNVRDISKMEDVNTSNYASNNSISASGSNNFMESVKSFISKYKWPIVGAIGLTAGVVAYKRMSNDHKKSTKNGR